MKSVDTILGFSSLHHIVRQEVRILWCLNLCRIDSSSKHRNIVPFSTIFLHWDGTSSWNPSSWKTMTSLNYRVNILAVVVLLCLGIIPNCIYLILPGPLTWINPLRAKFFRGNINIYLHFMSLLPIDMAHVFKFHPQVRPGPTYST